MNPSKAAPVMRLSAVGAVGAVLLAACGALGVTGAGPSKSDTRPVGPFTSVEAGNGIAVAVHVGAPQAVEVSAQENVMPLVATTVEGGVLKITTSQSYTTTEGVTVTISVAALDGISVSGGSHAQVDGIAAAHLNVGISGGAVVSASGTATDVALNASGGARADLGSLHTARIAMELSGGATGVLNASDEVTGSASGGAVATVAGGARISVTSTGGASVTGK